MRLQSADAPRSVFRSNTTLRLFRLLPRNKAPILGERMGPMSRVASPAGGSILITSAPKSPSSWQV